MRVRGAMRGARARAMRGLGLELEESVGHRDFFCVHTNKTSRSRVV